MPITNAPTCTAVLLAAVCCLLTGCIPDGGPAGGSPSVTTGSTSTYGPATSSEPEARPDADAWIGTWGKVSSEPASGVPYIVISEDGTAGGSDGCNFFGEMHWAVTGTRIEFTGGVQSLMACPNIDQWLSRRSTATLSGDTMIFFDEEGVEIGRLPRME